MNDLAESYFSLTPLQIKAHNERGHYTVYGYLHHLLSAFKSADEDFAISNVREFCRDWGITRASFYRSLPKLVEHGLLPGPTHQVPQEPSGRCLKYLKHTSFVLDRDGHKCVYCNSTRRLTLDHVIPQSRGGSDSPENLVACCKSCNSEKGARTPEEWLGEKS
jgi:5-methylcytosine-specific restriction endonuclease McrA